MLAVNQLNPPIQYDRIWMIIGLLVLVAIPLSFAIMLWLTRRRPFKSLDNLPQLPTGSELERLKAKYLQLIEEAYQRYQQHEITLRALHRALSMAARYFVYEVNHFPAPRLTLTDLQRAPYPTLTKLITDYYPEEFAALEHSEATTAVEAAKGFIRQWV